MPELRPGLRIETFILGDFQTNCHVVSVAEHDGCWIVDCGYSPEKLLAHVEASKKRVEAILLTHCHCDHIAGIDVARRRLGNPPVTAHRAERGFCETPALNLSAFVDAPVSIAEPSRWLDAGETLTLGTETFRVLHTPGHSPGGITLVHDASRQAIVGDTLFAGSIGRIDFPTSDPSAMERSLRDVLLALPDDMKIYPGHGPTTTIGRERGSNPYLLSVSAGSRLQGSG